MRPRERYGNQRHVQQTSPGDLEYDFCVKSFKPEAIIANTSLGGSASWSRKDRKARQEQSPPLSKTSFLSSPTPDAGKHAELPQVSNLYSLSLTIPVAFRLLLESGRGANPTDWTPLHQEETYIACVRNHPSAEERLIRRKARLTNMRLQPVMLGEFVGHEGPYCLNRK